MEGDQEPTKPKDDVVYSDKALSIVASWCQRWQHVVEDDVDHQPEEVARPPGLGLGAKFLPHQKAVGFNSGMQNSLADRIAGCSNQAHDRDEESEELSLCSTSSDEEESRVQAVTSKVHSVVQGQVSQVDLRQSNADISNRGPVGSSEVVDNMKTGDNTSNVGRQGSNVQKQYEKLKDIHRFAASPLKKKRMPFHSRKKRRRKDRHSKKQGSK